MDRLALHRNWVSWARRRLRRIGISTRKAADRFCDFETASGERVAIRVAKRSRNRRITRCGSRVYAYCYATWTFNLHRHAVKLDGIDWVICIALRGNAPFRVFVIPGREIRGKTVHVMKGRRRRASRRWHEKYENGWKAMAREAA